MAQVYCHTCSPRCAWFQIVSLMKMQTFSLADNAEDASHPPAGASLLRSSFGRSFLPPSFLTHEQIWSLRSHIARFFSLTRKKPSFCSFAAIIGFRMTYVRSEARSG